MKHWKIYTSLIRMIAPCSGFYILNQPLFNFRKLCFSFPGQIFMSSSVKNLGYSLLNLFCVDRLQLNLGPDSLDIRNYEGFRSGLFTSFAYLNLWYISIQTSHSGLIWTRFLRRFLLIIPIRISHVGKWTAIVDETRNGSVTSLILYTDLQLKRTQPRSQRTVHISPV